MRIVLCLMLLLAGCGETKRTDGVTASEAAALNDAAAKVDDRVNAAAPSAP